QILIKQIIVCGSGRVVHSYLKVITKLEVMLTSHPVVHVIGERSVDLQAPAKLIKAKIDGIKELTRRQILVCMVGVLVFKMERKMHKTESVIHHQFRG